MHFQYIFCNIHSSLILTHQAPIIFTHGVRPSGNVITLDNAKWGQVGY